MKTREAACFVANTPAGPVEYSHPGATQTLPPGHVAMVYQWRHVPTGKTGKTVVTLLRPCLFGDLLSSWNQQYPGTWEYSSLPS